MDIQIVIAMEADEVMLIALMIAHKDVLAMHTSVIFPPALGLLDGLAFRVVVAREWDGVLSQIIQHEFLTRRIDG